MPASARWRTWLWLAACLAFGAGFSVLRGQDAFWDLRNYHLYNAWALLHRRYGLDIAAAGLQTYFNPLADLPLYLLGTGPLADYPRLTAAFQGLWFGGLLFLLGSLALAIARIQGRRFDWADGLAVLIGISGSMAVSQAGCSSNEVPLAVMVLLGLRWLLPMYAAAQVSWLRALAAGLCCGLAAGLKPTAVVFVPAMALGLWLSWRPRRTGLALASAYAGAAGLGFLLAYGWWGWHLYQLTGNPVFPLFNQVFHSDWTTSDALTDERFKPHSIGQWLFYPFYWIRRNNGLGTELYFSDPRYALGMLALLAMAWRSWLDRSIRRPPSVAVLLGVFVAAGYVLWLKLYSILRYAIAFEALTGLLICMAIRAWLPADAAAPRRTALLMLGCFVLAASGTRYPHWEHASFARHSFDIELPDIEAGSLVVIAGQPHAYLAPYFAHADTMQFVGLTYLITLSEGHRLWSMAEQRLRQHQGPMYAAVRLLDRSEDALMQRLLPGSRLDDCRPIRSALERNRRGEDLSRGLSLCRIVRP